MVTQDAEKSAFKEKFKTGCKHIFGGTGKERTFNIVLYTIFFLFLVVMLSPFVYVILESFKSKELVNGVPTEIWSFAAYRAVLGGKESIVRTFLNTVFVTIFGTIFAVTLTTVGSYPLSRKNLKGRSFFLIYVLITMLFSGGLIPFYLLIRNVLQLTDSYWVYIIIGGAGAFNIFIVKGYFQGISEELYEAAALDGAGEFKIFLSVYLPLSKPIIATIALWIAVGKWNDYMTGLLYIKNSNKLLIQNTLRGMLSKATNTSGIGGDSSQLALSESIKMAAVIISLIPIMCVYPFVQKYFTKGVMLGSVKG
ncbi:MAG: carbohydrate ABC transporter permease [Clostridia bacterium]|nr:carbohydrate ABC transporter permease [Clostridia bacterium]